MRRGTEAVLCPVRECKSKGNVLENEMRFKNHAKVVHGMDLRPKITIWTRTAANLPGSPKPTPKTVLTQEQTSSPVLYVENAADMDVEFGLSRWEHDIYTSEANGLNASLYPGLPDTTDSPGRPEGHRWDISAQFDSPISHRGGDPTSDSAMSASEGFGPWEQLWTGLEGNPEGPEVYEQPDETEMTSPFLSYDIDLANDARHSFTPATQAADLQAATTFMFMESHPDISYADLLDPALQEHDASKRAPPETQDIEMEHSTGIPDDKADYPVECVLEKRGHMFYLQWKDGTRSWQHRHDVADDLVDPFEASWKGYHLGVAVLYKKPAGRAPFRLRFKDWPWKNATIWATYTELSPELRAQWPSKPRRRGRRSSY